MKLTKLERNKIYEAIARSGLDPGECELTITGAEAIIRHDSGSTFKFIQGFASNGEPVYEIRAIVVDGETHSPVINRRDIADLLEQIMRWANELKSVVEAIDYWAEAQRGRTLISHIQQGDTGNTPFTQDEQRQIAAQLHEIKKQLNDQFDLTTEQIEQIEERLDEAAEASKRI